jgi:hypothetical protein
MWREHRPASRRPPCKPDPRGRPRRPPRRSSRARNSSAYPSGRYMRTPRTQFETPGSTLGRRHNPKHRRTRSFARRRARDRSLDTATKEPPRFLLALSARTSRVARCSARRRTPPCRACFRQFRRDSAARFRLRRVSLLDARSWQSERARARSAQPPERTRVRSARPQAPADTRPRTATPSARAALVQ